MRDVSAQRAPVALSAAITTLADALASATNPGDIYRAALSSIRMALGVDRASVLLFDPDGVMRFKAWTGLSDAYRQAAEGHTPWTPGQYAAASIIVPDVRADASLAALQPAFAAENIRALTFVPVRSHRRVIGKFMLYWDQPHVPPPQVIEAAEAIGALIGLAVQRSRQNAEHEEQARRMRAALQQEAEARERLTRLVEGAQRLQISMDASHVVDEVLTLARNAVNADAYAIWRRAGDTWRIAASIGLDGAFASAELRGEQNLDFGSPVIAEDVEATPLLDRRRTAYRAAGIRSLLAIPLGIRGRSFGSLTFYYRRPHRPSDLELRIAQALGHLGASAIGSAELYAEQERLRQRAVEAAGRARFLADVSARLTSLEYETNLNTIARLVVPRFADWCIVDLLEGGELRRLAIAHSDETKVESARELYRRFPPRRDDPGGIWNVIRTGEPRLHERVDTTLLVRAASDPEERRILRDADIRSAMLVPLRRGTDVFGVLTFARAGSARPYNEDDLEFAQELARRASFAIENARLYRQAQEANRAKDDFLAALSHELRTPLNAILGWASILRARPEGQLERGLDVICRNAKAQAELVDDLLDASRIGSGRMSIDLKDVPLRPVLEGAIETVMPAATEKDIQLTSDLAAADVLIRGDAARLQQVYWNLLNNAVKFTPRGGRVTVTTEATPSEVIVHVADTGAGIKPESLPYIFDRFKQADASSTRRYRGLGLGLMLSRQLTEMHGGRISASSPGPGLGATFTVSLPLVERTTPASTPPPAGEAALSGLRILAVDDDPDSLEVLISLLRLHHAQVLGAASALEALELLQKEAIDLVISDIAMPDRDGYWLIEQAHRIVAEGGRKVPWIALTAFANQATRDRALAAGFAAHLSKPLNVDELVAVIRPLIH